MKRLLFLLLLLCACDPRDLNPPEGVAVGNPGSGKFTIGDALDLAMTSASARAATLRMEPCDGGVEVVLLNDPVDLLGDPGAELPPGTYCGLELSMTSLDVSGDGFAMSLDLPAIRFAVDDLVIDGSELTLTLGEDGWLTQAIVALAADPLDIAPGEPVHDLLVARLLHGVGLDADGADVAPIPQDDAGVKLVAVGLDGSILTSPNADDWTVSQRSGDDLWDVIWAEGQWVAVGGGAGPRVSVSANGVDWQDVPVPGDNYLLSVSWASGRFVAVGIHDTRLYSDDGVSWELVSSEFAPFTRGVAWGNDVFLAAGEGEDEGAFSTSANGSAWSPLTRGGSVLYDVHFAQGTFVMVGAEGRIATTADGQSLDSDVGGGQKLRAVTWHDGRWVAVGLGRASWSDDLETWQDVSVSPDLWDVTWAGERFVATGEGGEVLGSPDGETWTSILPGDGYPLFGLSPKVQPPT